MNPTQTAADDLSYVKHALDRGERSPFPPAIAVLWAVISAIGFSLNDLAPERAGLYWGVAAPLGFLLSIWLGHRGSRAAGVMDRREGMRWALHFGSLLLAFFVAGVGVALGAFSGAQMGGIALLLCGLAFLLAGIHLARRLAWVGLVMLAGLPLVLLLDQWRWTVVGAASALAMLAVGWSGKGRRGGGEA